MEQVRRDESLGPGEGDPEDRTGFQEEIKAD